MNIVSLKINDTIFGETEPNNNYLEADRILSNVDNRGQLSSTGDVDWFVVNITEGSEITIKFGAASALSTYANWNLAVYRPSDGAVIADYSFTSFGPTPDVRHVGIDQNGDFLIAVYSKSLNPAFRTEEYLFTIISEGANPQPQADSNYSGIWETSVGTYATVNQKDSELAIVLLGASQASGYNWEAQMGTMSGTTAIINTVYGYVNLQLRIEFTSTTAATITQISCSPLVAGFECRFLNGATFSAMKIF